VPQPLNVHFALGNLAFHLAFGFLLGQVGVQNGQAMLAIPEENAPEIIVLLGHHSVPFNKQNRQLETEGNIISFSISRQPIPVRQ
jgi:hypothetical protein